MRKRKRSAASVFLLQPPQRRKRRLTAAAAAAARVSARNQLVAQSARVRLRAQKIAAWVFARTRTGCEPEAFFLDTRAEAARTRLAPPRDAQWPHGRTPGINRFNSRPNAAAAASRQVCAGQARSRRWGGTPLDLRPSREAAVGMESKGAELLGSERIR